MGSLLEWLKRNGVDESDLRAEVQLGPKGERGLFAKENIRSDEAIISIPHNLLFNLKTLIALNFYPSGWLEESLSSTQALSLHLALFRPGSEALEAGDDVREAEREGKRRKVDRDANEDTNKARFFGPFINSLPSSFSTIPLYQDISSRALSSSPAVFSGEKHRTRDFASYGTRKCVDDVEKRFWDDWGVIIRLLTSWGQSDGSPGGRRTEGEEKEKMLVLEVPEFISLATGKDQLDVKDFAWGWLCVNTRCIWFDLELKGRKTDDNITLAPVIDMANHRNDRVAKPIHTPTHLTLYSSSPWADTTPFPSVTTASKSSAAHFSDEDNEDDASLFDSVPSVTASPNKKNASIPKGEEVLFSYGPHDDATLLAEYGFIVGGRGRCTDGDPEGAVNVKKGNEYNNVVVDDLVEELFDGLDEEDRARKWEVLERYGYRGDYTLQACPKPSQASHRLMVALRLFHFRPLSSPTASSTDTIERSFKDFVDHTMGLSDTISPSNEQLATGSLKWICETVVRRCDKNLGQSIEEEKSAVDGEVEIDDAEGLRKGLEAMLEMVRRVWDDERDVAREVLASL